MDPEPWEPGRWHRCCVLCDLLLHLFDATSVNQFWPRAHVPVLMALEQDWVRGGQVLQYVCPLVLTACSTDEWAARADEPDPPLWEVFPLTAIISYFEEGVCR